MSHPSSRFVAIAFPLLVLLTSMAPAQGVVYREKWAFLHLERLRAMVFDELKDRDVDAIAHVAELLAAEDGGVAIRPVAQALAWLRGVECDDQFQLRAAMAAFVLPEVVDGKATVAACRAANFTLYLPYPIELPGEVAFAIRVRDGDGRVVRRLELRHHTSFDDLRTAQAEASVPAGELPDGSYEVEIDTLIDGAGARAHDPRLRWRFHVLTGFQERCDLALGRARELREALPDLARAQLDGLAAEVVRVYTGEAFAVESTAVADLERLERCLANVTFERPPLAGMTGSVAAALPIGDIVQPVRLRLIDEVEQVTARPLVVFASAAPCYGAHGRRPIGPATRSALWLERELGSFGRARGWNVVCVDSPGGGRPYAKALLQTVQHLPELLPPGDRKPLLVCDREAAAVVALHLGEFREHISGLVLVGAGSLPKQAVAALGSLPVRLVLLHGYPGSRSIQRLLDYVAVRSRQGEHRPDVELLHDRELPWPFGVGLSLAEIEAFAESVFGG